MREDSWKDYTNEYKPMRETKTRLLIRVIFIEFILIGLIQIKTWFKKRVERFQ